MWEQQLLQTAKIPWIIFDIFFTLLFNPRDQTADVFMNFLSVL
jgi:hypothetical protein